MIPKVAEWKSAVTDLPTENGEYLVCRFFRGKFSVAWCLEYTNEYGWNTSPTTHQSPMDFSEDGEEYETLWTTLTLESEEDNDNAGR